MAATGSAAIVVPAAGATPPGAGSRLTTPPNPASAVQAAAPGSAAALTLAAQSATVGPGQNFDVRVQVGRGMPPVTDLGITVAVYGCLSSVSAFDQSLSSAGPSGSRLSTTRSPIPLGGLPVVAGAYDLSMPVTGVAARSPTPSGPFAIDLAGGGQCGAFPSGVYPVRLELVDTTSGQVLGGLTTHLVYAGPPAGTQKLLVAVILPIQTTLKAAVDPAESVLRARPAAALAVPPAAALDKVTATVNLIATAHPSVPLTLEASPQTVELLGSTGHQATLAQLGSLATAPGGVQQFTAAPFAPVDAAGLVDAGLSGELGQQVSQGVEVLEANGYLRPPATASGGTPQLGAWFADSALDTGTLSQLQSAGYGRLVLPSSSLTSGSSEPTNGSTVEPFTLTSTRGATMTALVSNTDISARFPGATNDPVLAAHQLVAELAQTYYERPNDTTARGVVAVAPSGWTDNPPFVDALLGALQATNPILQPVTTTTLFGALGPATGCRSCRLTGPAGTGGLPAGAIRTQRQRIDGLLTAAPTARAVGTQLGKVLLSGQAEDLTPAQQSAVVSNTALAVDAQLGQIAVAGDRTVTLTSHNGRVPVTIVSAAPYPVTASMTLTSDKLLFANRATTYTELVPLRPNFTNVIPVSVQSRASGQFKLDIVLRAPGTGMVLSSGQVSVRSTATSVVGIVLSLGAVVVLAAWWLRTSRKRRRARRAAAAPGTEEPAQPVTAG